MPVEAVRVLKTGSSAVDHLVQKAMSNVENVPTNTKRALPQGIKTDVFVHEKSNTKKITNGDCNGSNYYWTDPCPGP